MKSFVSVSADKRKSTFLKEKENRERARHPSKNSKLSFTLLCVCISGWICRKKDMLGLEVLL
jgi:hypothetical protein